MCSKMPPRPTLSPVELLQVLVVHQATKPINTKNGVHSKCHCMHLAGSAAMCRACFLLAMPLGVADNPHVSAGTAHGSRAPPRAPRVCAATLIPLQGAPGEHVLHALPIAAVHDEVHIGVRAW